MNAKATLTMTATSVLALMALGVLAGDVSAKIKIQQHPIVSGPTDAPVATAPTKPVQPITPIAGGVKMTRTLYKFSLNSFKITDTRSVHEDTDYVSISVVVGKNPPVTKVKAMGDVNNGTHAVNLVIDNIAADADQPVAFTYTIINSGYDQNTIEQDLKQAVGAAATKAAAAGATAAGTAIAGPIGGDIGGVVGNQAGGWLVGKLMNIIFANCDGTVAAGSHVYSGAQLAAQTANGKIISKTDPNPGTDSPTGCGSNSMYYVGWSASSYSAPIVLQAK
jgi:hypothetical protein